MNPFYIARNTIALEDRGLLGRGGMGVVHRVFDPRFGREAALKVLSGDVHNPVLVERFMREAQVTARLAHPSIPPVYDSGQLHDGRYFMLMKIIDGQTLEDHIEDLSRTRNEAKREELLRAMLRVGEALAYAHSQGIIHRDLKPANLMIGRFGEVLVMDWGLAKHVDEDDSALAQTITPESADFGSELRQLQSDGLTQAGTILGTPGYMAPEQAEGADEVDERADVFSIGVILTEILTEQKAIVGDSIYKVLFNTLKGEIASPRDLRASVSGPWNCLVEKTQAFELNERIRSAEDFVEYLKLVLAGKPLPFYRASLRERLERFLSEHWLLGLTMTFLSILLALVISIFAIVKTGQVQQQALKDQQLALKSQRDELRGTLADAREAVRFLNKAERLVGTGSQRSNVESLVAEALKKEGGSQSTIQRAAQLMAKIGFEEVALRYVEQGLKKWPGSAELIYLKFRCRRQFRVGDWEGLSRALPLKDSEAKGPFRTLAEAAELAKAGLYLKAIECFERDSSLLLERPALYVWKAQAYFDAHKYELALEECHAILKSSPRVEWARYLRALCHYHSVRLRQAQEDCEWLRAMNPSFLLNYQLRARIAYAYKDNEGVLKTAGEWLAVEPESVEAHARKTWALIRMKKFERAKPALERLEERAPRSYWLAVCRAQLLVDERKRVHEALSVLEDSKARGKAGAELHILCAQIKNLVISPKQDPNQKAVREELLAVENSDSKALAIYDYLNYLLETKKIKHFHQTANRVLNDSPKWIAVLHLKAESWRRQNFVAQAAGLLEYILYIDPNYKDAMVSLGLIWYSQQRYRLAYPYFERFLEVDPDRPEVRVYLTQCYHALGRVDKAIYEAEKTLREFPNVEFADQIRAQIARWKKASKNK